MNRSGFFSRLLAAVSIFSLANLAHANLGVSISANPDPAVPGEAVAVALTVTNTDNFARSGVQLRLPYPAGLQSLAQAAITDGGFCAATVSNNGACDVAEILSWSLGTIDAHSSKKVSLPPRVAAVIATGTLIAFNAEATDSIGASSTASETVQVLANRALELSLTEVTHGPAQPGGELIYQLNWGHTATSVSATGVVLSLPVPAGLTFVSADNGGALVAGAVQWTLGTLNPGRSGERRVVFAVNDAQTEGSAIRAEATLRDGGTQLTRADDVARVSAATGLQLAIDANANPAKPDEALAVALTVSNSSSFDRAGVVLRLRYPVGLQPLSQAAISDGGFCTASVSNNGACDVTEILSWSLGTVAAGTDVTVNLPPQIAVIAAGSLITWDAEVTDSTGVVSTAAEAVEVLANRALELSLNEVTQTPVQPGGELIYQLSWGYSATSTSATGVVLSLPVPAGLTFVSADNGGTLVGDTVQWTLGTLNPGRVGERRVVFAVDSDQAPGSSIKAEATLRDGGTQLTRADEVTDVEAATGLHLAIEAGASPAEPNEALNVALTVTNSSSFDRSGVVLRLRYPVGLQSLSQVAISDGGSCVASVSNNGACDATEMLSWNLGTVAAGKGVTVDLPPRVAAAAAAGTLIVFDAQVTDSLGAIAAANEVVAVIANRALELSLSEVTQDAVQPGAELIYQLSWGHSATSTSATGATLSLPVPAGLTFVSADNGGALVGNAVQWTLGTLNPGRFGERRAVFTAAADLPQGSAIKAEATLQDAGTQLTRADEITRVEAATGLQLAIEANTSPAKPNEVLGVALTVTNRSPFDRADVVLRTRFPVGLQALNYAAISDGGSCTASVSNNGACDVTEALFWNLGTIPAGTGITVSLPAQVAAAIAAGTLILFDAQATDSSGDIAQAQEVVAVTSARSLELQLRESGTEPVIPGTNVTYVANWGYSATSAALSGVTLQLPVPQGLTFVSANGGGVLVNGIVRWNLGTLQPGNIGELRATFAVPGAADYGAQMKAEATLLSSSGQVAQADDVTTIAEAVPLAVTVTVSPDPALPGASLGGAVAVANKSFFERTNVVLHLRYPVGVNTLAYASISNGGTCTASVSNNGACDSAEILNWNLGTLAGNATVTVNLPPVVAASIARGSLIPFFAWVEDNTTRSQVTDVIGIGQGVVVAVDADGDGIDDAVDNCLGLANPGQQDTNGDGYGNLCDPDLNNDGVVNATDFNLLRAAFFKSGSGLDADLNQDGYVNFLDLAILRTKYDGVPGPSALH